MLGEVLRAVTGKNYGPTIQKRILDPLGLASSVPTITHDVRSRLAVGYGPLFDDRPWWPGRPLAPATWLEADTADGSLCMTAADLATYLRMLLNEGDGPAGRLLSPNAFGLLTQRIAKTRGEESDFWYGYGVITGTQDGHRTIEHGGGMVGYFASMVGDMDLGIGVTALINGPGSPLAYTLAALDLIRAEAEGRPVQLPEIADPTETSTASDYEGWYRAHDTDGLAGRPTAFLASTLGNRLSLQIEGETIELRPSGDDSFVTAVPAFERFPLTFVRDADRIVGMMHGGAYYVKDSVPTPEFAAAPDEWLAFVGHYRSHNPWTTGFRVVLNRGRLWLILPAEPDGLELQQPLVPLGESWFRCGEDERIPERIRFDALIGGKAHRANLSLCDFYRVNTR